MMGDCEQLTVTLQVFVKQAPAGSEGITTGAQPKADELMVTLARATAPLLHTMVRNVTTCWLVPSGRTTEPLLALPSRSAGELARVVQMMLAVSMSATALSFAVKVRPLTIAALPVATTVLVVLADQAILKKRVTAWPGARAVVGVAKKAAVRLPNWLSSTVRLVRVAVPQFVTVMR